MAEAVGLAASVAGIVGLAGQIAQGCLFVANFLDDAQNAPEEVLRLKTEIGLIGTSAKNTEKVIRQSVQHGVVLEEDDYVPAIQQCLGVVQSLGSTIEKRVKAFAGDRRWWERMKAAARKKMLDAEVGRLERAKTQLHMVQINVSLAIQHRHQQALLENSQSIDHLRSSSSDTAATVDRVFSQGQEVSTITKSTHESVTTVSTQVAEMHSHLLAMRARIDKLEGIGSSLVERSVQSAVSNALAAHELQLTYQMADTSSRVIELRNSSPERPQLEDDGIQNLDMNRRSSVQRRERPRSRVIYQSEYKSWLFDVKVRTIQRASKSDLVQFYQGSSESLVTETTYDVRCKLPYIMSGLVLDRRHIESPYNGGIWNQMRTYNIVPYYAPIFEACRNFDLDEIRRLFDTAMASPFDQDEAGDTPLDVVLTWILEPRTLSLSIASKALQIIEFLIQCGACNDWSFNGVYATMAGMYPAKDPETSALRASAFRRLLEACPDNTLEDSYLPATLSNFDVPEINFILHQQDFVLWRSIRDENCIMIESDYDMLQDPNGNSLRQALARGSHMDAYFAYGSGSVLVGSFSGMHSVLEVAWQTKREDIIECCVKRLLVFLHHQPGSLLINVTTPEIQHSTELQILSGSQFTLWEGIPSFADYVIRLECQGIWASALERSNLSGKEVQEARDDITYGGIPELFGGLHYTSIEENQTGFVYALCYGLLLSSTPIDLDDRIGRDLLWMLGYRREMETPDAIPLWITLNYFEVLIENANRAFLQRSVPGGWIEDDGQGLVPGVDFSFPGAEDIWEDLEAGYLKYNGDFLAWYGRYQEQRGEAVL